jgi:hypothetical protein
MEFRFGCRSTGGIVKAGHGGYYVVPGFVPVVEYTDPDTGHDHSGIHSADGSWQKGAETGGSTISSHPFIAPPGEPWERCVDCGLARSAHMAELVPYAPDTPHAEVP